MTKSIMKKTLLGTLLLTASILPAAAVPNEPLHMEGKKSLYQRILTIPGARIHSAADTQSTGKGSIPFTAYYVYDRVRQGGTEWLQVGDNRHGRTIGWLPANDTLDWPQGLTVAFRAADADQRSLLFRDRDSLKQLIDNGDRSRYDALYQAAVAGNSDNDSPVVAIQPAGHIDIHKDFYLVPIEQHEDVFLGSEQARLLKVASVPLQLEEPTAEKPAPVAEQRNYTAGLVFAIDSTLSMDPYIQRTREGVMKIYDHLGDAGLLGNVNFGLVAFRDNPRAAPDIEYLTRTYVNLEQGANPATFIKSVNGLSAATNSSKDFKEDAYAGIKAAIDQMQWDEHAARYIVLVTDAGPRDGNDPLSGTGMSAEGLRQLAQEKGIAIFVLHLLTPATMADHAAAATRYKALSDYPGIGSLYYSVTTGDVQEFGQVLDALATQITRQVAQATNAALEIATPEPEPVDNPQLAQLQAKVAKLGYALRMQYLQETSDGKPPRVFDAWLLDHDFRNPERRALDVRVLLTRDQLSDLHDILKQVLNTAEEGLLSPQNFLNELKSLAATISRDPERLGATTAVTGGRSLAEMGFMREYIEGLPYAGEVMSLSLEDWQSWPAREQIAFLHRLEEKINYYRALHDHTDLWISLDGGPVNADSVFPLTLEMLP